MPDTLFTGSEARPTFVRPATLGEFPLKQIRKRFTYSNVMSTLAVFLILGGATAFAAVKKIGPNEIKANSIKTGKIVKEAVTAGKLKKGAVGTAKIANGAVTNEKIADNAVTTSKIANDAVTGDKVNESTLGTVPSANNANAANGIHFAKINFVGGPNTPKTTIFSADGLTLSAECDGAAELNLLGTTSVDHAEIYESGNFTSTFDGSFNDDFNIGEVEEVGQEIGDGTQNEIQGQVVYSTLSGAVVTVQFSINDGEVPRGGLQGCNVEGIASFS